MINADFSKETGSVRCNRRSTKIFREEEVRGTNSSVKYDSYYYLIRANAGSNLDSGEGDIVCTFPAQSKLDYYNEVVRSLGFGVINNIDNTEEFEYELNNVIPDVFLVIQENVYKKGKLDGSVVLSSEVYDDFPDYSEIIIEIKTKYRADDALSEWTRLSNKIGGIREDHMSNSQREINLKRISLDVEWSVDCV